GVGGIGMMPPTFPAGLKRVSVEGIPTAAHRRGSPGADSPQLFFGKFAGGRRIRRHARQLANGQTVAIFRVDPCSNNIYRHFLCSFQSILITGRESSLCSETKRGQATK